MRTFESLPARASTPVYSIHTLASDHVGRSLHFCALYSHARASTPVCIHTYTHIYIHAVLHVWVYVCIHMCVYISIYINTCMKQYRNYASVLYVCNIYMCFDYGCMCMYIYIHSSMYVVCICIYHTYTAPCML